MLQEALECQHVCRNTENIDGEIIKSIQRQHAMDCMLAGMRKVRENVLSKIPSAKRMHGYVSAYFSVRWCTGVRGSRFWDHTRATWCPKWPCQVQKLSDILLALRRMDFFVCGIWNKIHNHSCYRERQHLLADKEEILNNQRGIEQLREINENLNTRAKEFEKMRTRHLGMTPLSWVHGFLFAADMH